MTVDRYRSPLRASLARGRERGAVAVELALVLPLFIILLFGVTTAGLAYSDHLAITNAVREASRLGASVDYTPSSTTWADSVQTRVKQVYFNAGSQVETSQICVQLVDSGGAVLASPTAQGSQCGTAPDSPSGLASGTCVVKVWVRKPAKITLVVAPELSFSIGAQSVAHYGRSVGSCVTA